MHSGAFGDDAKVKEFDGNAVINFTLAVNALEKGERVTIWYGCSLWRRKDKIGIAEHLKKGTAAAVSGRPSIELWQDKQGLGCNLTTMR